MNQKPRLEIEPIMEQIRQQINRQGKKQPESFDFVLDKGVSAMNLDELKVKLNESWNVGQRPFTSHRPIIGPFIVWYKKILFQLIKLPLCNVLEDQRNFNMYLAQTINQINLQHLLARTDFLFTELDKRIETLAAKFQAAQKNQQEFNDMTLSIRNALWEEQAKLAEVHQQTQSLESSIQYINQSLSEILHALDKLNQIDELTLTIRNALWEEQAKLAAVHQHTQSLESNFQHINQSVNELIDWYHKEKEGLDAHQYHLFNERFRDTIEHVKKRQQIYIDYFRDCKNIVDLGCGRGEFLELLQENNLPALGIDINPELVELAKQRGLNVTCADLLTFLAQTPDATFDGIFSAQVIEHFKLPDIRQIVGLIYQKLQPDGIAVVETLNPLSFYSYSRNYLLDLTHQRALHPQALKFLFDCHGFREVEIKFTSAVPLEEMLEGIELPKELTPEEETAWQKINLAFSRLNELFYGWQEYAIIAKK
ncbi:MAG: class I SAM-dependent methyltransferase [bacterium]|nr:class I SAM-dependent methyltransferase [bacterium]